MYTRYFDLLEQLIADHKFLPRNMWNLDESMVKPKNPKVLAKKGTRTVHALTNAPWPHVSILATVNCAGEVLPPLIINTAKTVMEKWTADESIPGTLYASTANGWMMDRATNTPWFIEHFVPHVNLHRGRRDDGSLEPVPPHF